MGVKLETTLCDQSEICTSYIKDSITSGIDWHVALFKAIGMQVSIAARPGKKDDPRPSLASLLPHADVVSLHCPLTEDTDKLINADTLSLMQPTAFLINTARGGLIDEQALYHALKHNKLGGAGLDVLSVEPPPADHV